MNPSGGLLAAARILMILALVFRLSGRKLPSPAVGALSLLSFVAAVWSVYASDAYYVDARFFWTAGRDVWEGNDPYAHSQVLNPPSALPFFALLSLLPLAVFLAVWKTLGLAGYAALLPLSRVALREPGREPREDLAPPDLLLLSAAMVVSVAAQFALQIGQLPFITALAAIGAVGCRASGRPVAAGVLLSVAAIKYTTMIPILLLFLRRRDLKTWASMTISGFVLTFMAIRPTHLLQALRENWTNIVESGAAGAVNDYSFAGPNCSDLVGLNLAVYHLGVRHRGLVSAMSLAVLLVLILWIAWQLYRRPAIAHAPAAAIVTCFAAIFLYHRQYDMVVLALPLAYTFMRSLSEPTRRRWFYRACAVGLVGVLFEPVNVLHRLLTFSQSHGAIGRVVEALVLPAATWILLGIVVGLTLVERRRGEEAAVPA